jgi:hypothetical protein
MYDNNSSPSLMLSLTLILLCMTNKYGKMNYLHVPIHSFTYSALITASLPLFKAFSSITLTDSTQPIDCNTLYVITLAAS